MKLCIIDALFLAENRSQFSHVGYAGAKLTLPPQLVFRDKSAEGRIQGDTKQGNKQNERSKESEIRAHKWSAVDLKIN